jgi:diketogulonate reductase-like aldo/keto reductase
LQSVKEIGYGKAWSLMEDVLKEGKTRSIGVSNYMIDEMTEMLETAKVSQIIRWITPLHGWGYLPPVFAMQVIPAVNQIEFHPYCYPYLESLVRLCHERGITIECYGPLSPITKGKGGPLDPVLQKIAGQTGLNEGQVLLKWAKQVSRGVIVT